MSADTFGYFHNRCQRWNILGQDTYLVDHYNLVEMAVTRINYAGQNNLRILWMYLRSCHSCQSHLHCLSMHLGAYKPVYSYVVRMLCCLTVTLHMYFSMQSHFSVLHNHD